MSCFKPNFVDRKTKVFLGKVNKKQDSIPVACGQCIGCRLDYSINGANRVYGELQDSYESYFVTLTYSDENLVFNRLPSVKEKEKVVDLFNNLVNTARYDHRKFKYQYLKENFKCTGKEMNASLDPRHVKNFMKRLREYYRRKYKVSGIRYLLCGEYGSQSNRPHYHLIIFNLPIEDLKYKFKKNDFLFFTSEIIERIGKKGQCIISSANGETAAYVARYVIKKWKGRDAGIQYWSKGQYPEFFRMSNRPGIGYRYLEKNKERIYSNDLDYVSRNNKIYRVRPARYFDMKVEELFEMDINYLELFRKMNILKDERQMFMEKKKKEIENIVGYDYFEYLKKCHYSKIKKTMLLNDRSLESDI